MALLAFEDTANSPVGCGPRLCVRACVCVEASNARAWGVLAMAMGRLSTALLSVHGVLFDPRDEARGTPFNQGLRQHLVLFWGGT